MFGWFANLLDKAPDEQLGELLGKEYSSSVSRIGLSVLMFILTMLMLTVVWWSGTHIPETKYQQVTFVPQGKPQVKPLYTFPLPVFSAERIQKWTLRALSETLTFNFTDVDQRLNDAGVYYTPAARESMKQAIARDQIVETVKASRLQVALTPISPPYVIRPYKVKSEGVETLYWEVEAPVILTYTGASRKDVKGMKVFLRIKQVPTTESPDGLAIAGFFTRTAPIQ